MPSRDIGDPKLEPQRHGCPYADADPYLWDEVRAPETAMPFHPTCLEVFKRASLRRLGRVDVRGLLDWWGITGHSGNFDRHPAARRAGEQWWNHRAGGEFLAANPCFVPELPGIFASVSAAAATTATTTASLAGVGGDERGDPDRHRPICTAAAAEVPAEKDIFSRLSYDETSSILALLSIEDVANLALASPTMRRLPQSLFRELVLRDLPWLWEAWCGMDYAWLSTTTAKDVEAADAKFQAEQTAILDAIRVLEKEQEEEEEEAGGEKGKEKQRHDAAIAALTAKLSSIRRAGVEARQPVPAPQLRADTTDWFRLYRAIGGTGTGNGKETTRWGPHDRDHGRQLKGLRNRRRIWADCQSILDAMKSLRREGRIGEGIVVDFAAEAERRHRGG